MSDVRDALIQVMENSRNILSLRPDLETIAVELEKPVALAFADILDTVLLQLPGADMRNMEMSRAIREFFKKNKLHASIHFDFDRAQLEMMAVVIEEGIVYGGNVTYLSFARGDKADVGITAW